MAFSTGYNKTHTHTMEMESFESWGRASERLWDTEFNGVLFTLLLIQTDDLGAGIL